MHRLTPHSDLGTDSPNPKITSISGAAGHSDDNTSSQWIGFTSTPCTITEDKKFDLHWRMRLCSGTDVILMGSTLHHTDYELQYSCQRHSDLQQTPHNTPYNIELICKNFPFGPLNLQMSKISQVPCICPRGLDWDLCPPSQPSEHHHIPGSRKPRSGLAAELRVKIKGPEDDASQHVLSANAPICWTVIIVTWETTFVGIQRDTIAAKLGTNSTR